MIELINPLVWWWALRTECEEVQGPVATREAAMWRKKHNLGSAYSLDIVSSETVATGVVCPAVTP